MLPIIRRILQNRERRRRNRRLIAMRRNLRDSYDPFTLPDERFIELFRLNKIAVRNLIQEVTPHLPARITVRRITPDKKVFVALQFYATGTYQRPLGEQYNFGMSQSAVHFAIHEITNIISTHLAPRCIRFPTSVAERNENKEQFSEMYGFPGAIGAIDGTHIAISKPSQAEEHNFFNRKGFHSVNCQLICDAKMKILNVLANFGGASHDSYIWNRSNIKEYMENNLNRGEQAWLIGDSGYPQSTVLMTPFRNPAEGTPEARYNAAHMRARNVIERCNGVLKTRFRCLLKERTAHYNPRVICEVIKACAVLHNICIEENLEVLNEFPDEDNPENPNLVQYDANNHQAGIQARHRLVQRYFRN